MLFRGNTKIQKIDFGGPENGESTVGSLLVAGQMVIVVKCSLYDRQKTLCKIIELFHCRRPTSSEYL